MPTLQEARAVVPLALAKPVGLGDLGAPLTDATVVKKGRLREILQTLPDGAIGRRFQDIRVVAIRTVEAGVPSAKVFVQFEVFGDDTAAPPNGAGFDAVLLAGSEPLVRLSSPSLFLPYGDFWHPNRFVFDVALADFDRADSLEFVAKPEEVRRYAAAEAAQPSAGTAVRLPGAGGHAETEPAAPTYPRVARTSHRMLGDMLRMMLSERLSFDLTLEEGKTLSRAFTALAHDWRLNDRVYLSPVGGDREFSAAVTEDGLDVDAPEGGHRLSWDDVRELAERLVAE